MFALSSQPIAVPELRALLDAPEAGGVVTFEGRVRNHNQGRSVTGLDYEAYPELAVREGEAIVREATERFHLTRVVCVHRVGHLDPGELAIWIGVAAPHRDDAFSGCRHVIEEVKQRLPVWKQERYSDGDARWINAS